MKKLLQVQGQETLDQKNLQTIDLISGVGGGYDFMLANLVPRLSPDSKRIIASISFTDPDILESLFVCGFIRKISKDCYEIVPGNYDSEFRDDIFQHLMQKYSFHRMSDFNEADSEVSAAHHQYYLEVVRDLGLLRYKFPVEKCYQDEHDRPCCRYVMKSAEITLASLKKAGALDNDIDQLDNSNIASFNGITESLLKKTHSEQFYFPELEFINANGDEYTRLYVFTRDISINCMVEAKKAIFRENNLSENDVRIIDIDCGTDSLVGGDDIFYGYENGAWIAGTVQEDWISMIASNELTDEDCGGKIRSKELWAVNIHADHGHGIPAILANQRIKRLHALGAKKGEGILSVDPACKYDVKKYKDTAEKCTLSGTINNTCILAALENEEMNRNTGYKIPVEIAMKIASGTSCEVTEGLAYDLDDLDTRRVVEFDLPTLCKANFCIAAGFITKDMTRHEISDSVYNIFLPIVQKLIDSNAISEAMQDDAIVSILREARIQHERSSNSLESLSNIIESMPDIQRGQSTLSMFQTVGPQQTKEDETMQLLGNPM